MCFKKIWNWFKPDPVIPITGEKVALFFGLDNYLGQENDLRFCIKDIDDEIKKFQREFPDWQIRRFTDSEITNYKVTDEILAAYASPAKYIYWKYSGHGTSDGINQGLYLHNGPFWDKAILELEDKTPPDKFVTAVFDSCFSGGYDEGFLKSKGNKYSYIKNRFYPIPGIRLSAPINKQFCQRAEGRKWIFIAACGPDQTAAEVMFGNEGNGAFTHFDLRSYGPITKTIDRVNSSKELLKLNDFEQIPEIVGPEERINELVFS
jgi:hypothetical protein